MSILRIFAIVCIFLLGCAGWATLGTVSAVRSGASFDSLERAVVSLWGEPLRQLPPSFQVQVPGTGQSRQLLPSANAIRVNLALEQRRKGLIWYPTYVADMQADYTISNPTAVAQRVRLRFPLPSARATYDNIRYGLDGQVRPVEPDLEAGIRDLIPLAPGESRTVSIAYRTRGLGRFGYALGESGRVRDLDFQLVTNAIAVDFPEGSLSPMALEVDESGSRLRWRAADLLPRQDVAVIMPEKLNPGPLSARISFFAPVCLLFFFVLITAIGILRGIQIHPMHYLFVTAGFFAFHLLFAYLVDVLAVHLAFGIGAVVSVLLVTGYLRTALGVGFPWPMAALGQLFYLVLFSYSFFLKGMTGLTVTIGSVLTLAVLMFLTARLDWGRVFAGGKSAPSGKEALSFDLDEGGANA